MYFWDKIKMTEHQRSIEIIDFFSNTNSTLKLSHGSDHISLWLSCVSSTYTLHGNGSRQCWQYERGTCLFYSYVWVTVFIFTIHNSQYLYCLPTYKLYDTQRKYTNNILLTYSYIYFNEKPILWEQRELEILLDLWAPCLIHFISTRVQGVQGCNSDNTVISSVIGNIQFCIISAKVNYYRLLSLNF